MGYQQQGADATDSRPECPHFVEHGKHNWAAVNGIYEPWLCLSCKVWKNEWDKKAPTFVTVEDLREQLSEYDDETLVFTTGYDSHYEEPYVGDPLIDDIDVLIHEDGTAEQVFHGDEHKANVKAIAIR